MTQHIFDLQESQYAELIGEGDSHAILTFPAPFTLTHYIQYMREVKETKYDKRNGVTADERMYRAAHSLATLETDLRHEPDDGELETAFQTWVLECADKYIAPMIRIEAQEAIRARRRSEDSHRGVVFEIDEAAEGLLPALVDYEGELRFAPSYTARMHKAFVRELEDKPHKVANDIENTLFIRQFRAACDCLLVSNSITDVAYPPELAERQELIAGDDTPLVLVAWVNECADTYLWHRTNQKK